MQNQEEEEDGPEFDVPFFFHTKNALTSVDLKSTSQSFRGHLGHTFILHAFHIFAKAFLPLACRLSGVNLDSDLRAFLMSAHPKFIKLSN